MSEATLLGIGRSDLYKAVLARDRRFDGRMFVGVRSTRIYCRPICTVRPPRFENCSFYRTAAAAEGAGFRPCLRCRPELAPGSVAPVDAVPRLAASDLGLLKASGLSPAELRDRADRWRPWRGCAAVLLWHSLSGPRDRRQHGERNNGTISK